MTDKTPARDSGWAGYYQAHEGRPASALLRRALTYVGARDDALKAIDLGCGTGSESRFLLEAGWQVFAVDKEPMAIELVGASVPDDLQPGLETAVARFEELDALPPSALIHAGLSLPFCRPDHFARLWHRVTSALEPGGIFVGHLFGDRDEWSHHKHMTFHTADEVAALFEGFTVEYLREIDEKGKSMQGPKHWHRFDVIAKKLS